VFHFPVVGPDATAYSDPKISGGGQGQAQVTHAISTVFWVTGLRCTEAFAYMESFDLPVDLVDAITYRMDNGAVGAMGATGSVMPEQPQNQEYIYYGSEGFLRQDVINGKLDYHLNDGTSVTLPDASEDEIYPQHLPARRLADLVLGEGENLAPGAIGAYTVEFLEAAYRSAESGQPARIDTTVP
jgi:predicted dehydrogenase